MKKKALVSPRIKEKASVLTIVVFVVLIIYFLSLLVPVCWAIYTSFNDKTAYRAFYLFGQAFPTKLTFDNYVTAFTKFTFTARTGGKFNFLEMIGHSLIYAFGSAFIFTLTPCLVAYCAARFKFKFSTVIYVFVIITMSLPIVGAMPSELRMLKMLGIYDTFFGMFVLRANFLSINFLIFYAQFKMIPMTYSEAAKVDGASNFRIMTTVIFPQAFPTMTTIFLLNFITFWNDYQIPRVYLPSYPTLAEGLFTFALTGERAVNYVPIKLAGFIGLTLPIVIVFALLNKYLKLNVAAGGIKG